MSWCLDWRGQPIRARGWPFGAKTTRSRLGHHPFGCPCLLLGAQLAVQNCPGRRRTQQRASGHLTLDRRLWRRSGRRTILIAGFLRQTIISQRLRFRPLTGRTLRVNSPGRQSLWFADPFIVRFRRHSSQHGRSLGARSGLGARSNPGRRQAGFRGNGPRCLRFRARI